jgi:hypothetical protein
MGKMTDSSEHAPGPSGSIKRGEFPDYLCNYQLLKKVSVPWSCLVTSTQQD